MHEGELTEGVTSSARRSRNLQRTPEQKSGTRRARSASWCSKTDDRVRLGDNYLARVVIETEDEPCSAMPWPKQPFRGLATCKTPMAARSTI